jgi:hypothetical protein
LLGFFFHPFFRGAWRGYQPSCPVVEGAEKAGLGDFEIKPEKLLSTLLEILERENTAEVKKVKDGILVLEVKRETKLRGDVDV